MCFVVVLLCISYWQTKVCVTFDFRCGSWETWKRQNWRNWGRKSMGYARWLSLCNISPAARLLDDVILQSLHSLYTPSTLPLHSLYKPSTLSLHSLHTLYTLSTYPLHSHYTLSTLPLHFLHSLYTLYTLSTLVSIGLLLDLAMKHWTMRL